MFFYLFKIFNCIEIVIANNLHHHLNSLALLRLSESAIQIVVAEIHRASADVPEQKVLAVAVITHLLKCLSFLVYCFVADVLRLLACSH